MCTYKRERDRQTDGDWERKRDRDRQRMREGDRDVCWLLNLPATCKCVSGMDLLRQFYVLPH